MSRREDGGPGPADAAVAIWSRRSGRAGLEPLEDRVAVEEPLEILLAAGGERRTVAVTMRTPGADEELAAGFLFGEGLVRDRALVADLRASSEIDPGSGARRDQVEVELAARRLPDLRSLERHFFTGSACGVCGRASLDELLVAGCEPAEPGPSFPAATILALPESLRSAQRGFAATGGLHAAALFDRAGRLLTVREDVGRHNALDKLIGRALLDGELGWGEEAEGQRDRRLARHAVLVSGRASFELVQKCVVAGVPLLAAVSAPTSLAVELAARFGITLVAFLREGRFNVYSRPERIGAG
ncbi:MAG TPA: formate dehydrogenase accessory sulfurtransferase FdhD [Thermoanaerobaculia bacterium]|nr:formate dehydrogenase accessory sulfurtransferase FdhD [Thermoanaerobaculia bacterium]